MVLGLMLAAAVTLDIRWLKNRHKVLDEVYVTPIHHRMDDAPSAVPGSGTPYALNNEISQTDYIGLDELEGPEDVILDRDDHLYCGTRHGEIIRFFAPDYKKSEVFAHTGGFPLGLAFDQAGNLLSCVGAMGLYSISPDRVVTRLSAETRRTWTSVVDDARLRDPTIATWRPTAGSSSPIPPSATTPMNGRWIRSRRGRPAACSATTRRPARPRPLLEKLRYANGVCMAHDGKSLFLAESWACSRAPLLVRRAEGRHGRMRDQGHAGLPRQHQPRLGRHLLDGLARHAHAELRSVACAIPACASA